MIENQPWADILATATDFSVVCELYSADQTPTVDGFDPNDAIKCYAAVDGISFAGVGYQRMVKSFGSIGRTITNESNTASVQFSNISREISQFEFSTGFEGLILIIRLISRSQSVSIDISEILFAGRCEKPTTGDKQTLTVKANWILGGLDVTVPRRKYTKEDQEGRVPTDPEFEGFLFIPQYGTSSYSVRQKRGGIAGFFGFKKTVQKTLSYSSFSDIDANKPVPLVLGRAQLSFTHIGYEDVGIALRIRTAACDGPIYGFDNVRSLDDRLPLSVTSYAEVLGLVGAANGPDDPSWVAPGYYSRTAHIRCQADNSTVEDVEPAPEIVGVIMGTVPIPDGSGDWVVEGEFCDDAAAHTRYLLTSPDYFNLDENWIDDPSFYETYIYDGDAIIDHSLTDFVFATPA